MLSSYSEILSSISPGNAIFRIITPLNPEERGAQLCVLLLRPGLLDTVMKMLSGAGVIVDKRAPDVVRVAPVPLYNSFEDVYRFAEKFKEALTQGTS